MNCEKFESEKRSKEACYIFEEGFKYIANNFFGLGNKGRSCSYTVRSIKDLTVIKNLSRGYPLITKKCADYLLFKMAVNLILNNEHLTIEGLRLKGLSTALVQSGEFLDIVPIARPIG